MLTRVTFQFPDGNEERYLQLLPAVDDIVTGRGHSWTVIDVDLDTVGGHVVTLGRKRQSKGGVTAAPDLPPASETG